MEKAPVLQHHVLKFGELDDERAFREARDRLALFEIRDPEMIVEGVAARDRGPIAVGVETRHALIGVQEMIRRPDVVGIEESDEVAVGGNIIETGIARATRPAVRLADYGDALPFFLGEPGKLVRYRIGGFVVDHEKWKSSSV